MAMDPQDVEIIDLTQLSLTSPAISACGTSHEMSEDTSAQWYQDSYGSHPFSLTVKSKASHPSSFSFTGIEFFPWGETPFEHLWNGGSMIMEDNPRSHWLALRSKWRNIAVVCGGHIVRLIRTCPPRQGAPVFQVSLPVECRHKITHATWALNPWNLHPLIIYVHTSVLHIFDVEAQEFLGCIRGHGADITSLGAHRTHPHIVFTTSRDFSTRIYDFSIIYDKPTLDSSPKSFGRAETDDGDSRIGKCVTVLTGGRSGGHDAAVLGADFHPSLPLIVTCGMDHAVRIWHLKPQLFHRAGWPPKKLGTLSTEDKPLFSSALIHKSRVLSVHWVSVDLLVSHSAPPLHIVGGFAETGSGTLAIWQWLSLGRFFPPDAPIYRETPLRGCISDYRESCMWSYFYVVHHSNKGAKASFKIISLSQLPADASRLSMQPLRDGPPLLLLSIRSRVLVLNPSQLSPRKRPILHDDRDHEETPQSKRERVSGAIDDDRHTDVEGWTMSVVLGEDLEDEELGGCALSPDGRKVAAVGTREGIWMWNAG